MKKITWKLIACLMAALLLCMPVLTGCDLFDKSSEGLEFTSNGDGTCSVSGIGECTDVDVVIPEESPDGDRVTSIGDAAFYGCTGLTSITIPDSVTSIGYAAFYGCTGLTSIKVSEGNSVYHSQGNCLIETESKTLIAGCQSSIIPDDGSVTSIGDCAFYGCTGLTSITIPDSVTSIKNGAFYGCTGLTNIVVQEGNPAYHSDGNCLIETRSKTLIAGCQNSTIPSDGSVTSIGDYAFSSCTGLTSITIPDSVTSIGICAFEDCTGLTSITIPDSVTSIGYAAFYGCTGLTSIKVSKGNSVYHSQGNCLIETESKTLIAGCQSSIIPDDGSVTSIGDCAFYGCTGLTSITIPDSVTSIEGSAFEDCTGLTSITIPDSVTSIGICAFEDCTGLTSITIPDSVTSIGDCAFYGCTGLTSITIPDSVTSIEGSAFEDCTGLTSITIPDSVTSIGICAFEDCTGLTSITIPDSVTSIEGKAFYGCTGLTSITIPDSVTSIGICAFEDCTGLTSITIPDSVTSIGGVAFDGCTGLTDVHYSGTKDQWQAIEIGECNDSLSSATIHCTDGDITPKQ